MTEQATVTNQTQQGPENGGDQVIDDQQTPSGAGGGSEDLAEQTAENLGDAAESEAGGDVNEAPVPSLGVSHGEVAEVHETATPDLVPPLQETHVQEPTEAESEIARLSDYLHARFADQVDLTNRQHPESAVDTAIRLLDGYAARSTLQHAEERCAEQFCNKTAGHTDHHGWIHFG